MNKRVFDELSKCKVCNLPYYDENTTSMIIPLYNNDCVSVELVRNHYYIIKVSDMVLNPPENDTIRTNWNKGRMIHSKYLLVTPTKVVGKMMQFDGCGWDMSKNIALDDCYSDMWVSKEGISVVREHIC